MVRRLGKGDAVVPRLMEGLPGKAYINRYKLYVDSWYTIEKLFFSFLSENEIASWGAPRKNRLRLPASITTPRLPKGCLLYTSPSPRDA